MKYKNVLFLIFLTVNYSFGQSLPDLQKAADSLYNSGNFSLSAKKYAMACRLVPENQPTTLFRLRLAAARSWASANLPDSAFVHLDSMLAIKNMAYFNLMDLITNRDLQKLNNYPQWWATISKFYSLVTNEMFYSSDDSYSQEEIIYGRKDGMALSMLRLAPKSKINGKAIILIRSGGWSSSFFVPRTDEAKLFLQNGYNVFIVFHGSKPLYSVKDAIEDLQRAVRFIRFNSKTYSIGPDKIGAMGNSAGGHLALMLGLSDTFSTQFSPDPIDRVSSKVNAAVSRAPTVNFFDWDGKGNNAFSSDLLKQVGMHVLEFRKWDAQRRNFVYIKEEAEINEILKEISPINHVSENDAAILIFHGDQDELVPISQPADLVEILKDKKVPVFFQVKKGGGHGWQYSEDEWDQIMRWFQKYL